MECGVLYSMYAFIPYAYLHRVCLYCVSISMSVSIWVLQSVECLHTSCRPTIHIHIHVSYPYGYYGMWSEATLHVHFHSISISIFLSISILQSLSILCIYIHVCIYMGIMECGVSPHFM